MSELVEKVARVLAGIYADENFDEYQLEDMKLTREDCQNWAWDSFTVEARAAIRAVAEYSMSNYYAETSILRFWTEVLAQLGDKP